MTSGQWNKLASLAQTVTSHAFSALENAANQVLGPSADTATHLAAPCSGTDTQAPKCTQAPLHILLAASSDARSPVRSVLAPRSDALCS